MAIKGWTRIGIHRPARVSLRRPGARHLSHGYLGFALACSATFHGLLLGGLLLIADEPLGAAGIEALSAVSAFQVPASSVASEPRRLGGDGMATQVRSVEPPPPALKEPGGQVVAMGDGGVPLGTLTNAAPRVPVIPPVPAAMEKQPALPLPTAPFVPAPSSASAPSVRKDVVQAEPSPGVVATPSPKPTPARAPAEKVSSDPPQATLPMEGPAPGRLRPAEVLTPVTPIPSAAPGLAAP